jgi:hypothetical protein
MESCEIYLTSPKLDLMGFFFELCVKLDAKRSGRSITALSIAVGTARGLPLS